MSQEATYKIRLVTTHYSNRLEWEDGPGSLQNVVSDASHEYRSLDRLTLAEAEALTKSDIEDGYGYYLENDSHGGFEEFSHKLEYLDTENGKWRLVKVLW